MVNKTQYGNRQRILYEIEPDIKIRNFWDLIDYVNWGYDRARKGGRNMTLEKKKLNEFL
jgi:hypothetical protein